MVAKCRNCCRDAEYKICELTTNNIEMNKKYYCEKHFFQYVIEKYKDITQ